MTILVKKNEGSPSSLIALLGTAGLKQDKVATRQFYNCDLRYSLEMTFHVIALKHVVKQNIPALNTYLKMNLSLKQTQIKQEILESEFSLKTYSLFWKSHNFHILIFFFKKQRSTFIQLLISFKKLIHLQIPILEEATYISSVAQLCLTLYYPMDFQASLSLTNSQSLLKLMSIKSAKMLELHHQHQSFQ